MISTNSLFIFGNILAFYFLIKQLGFKNNYKPDLIKSWSIKGFLYWIAILAQANIINTYIIIPFLQTIFK